MGKDVRQLNPRGGSALGSTVRPVPQKSWRRLIGPRDPSGRIFAWGAWMLLASPFLFFAYLLFFKGHCG